MDKRKEYHRMALVGNDLQRSPGSNPPAMDRGTSFPGQVPTNLPLNTYQPKERLNSGKPKGNNRPRFRKNTLKISDDLCAAAVSTPILAFSFNK